MTFATVILPLATATGADLSPVHMVFAHELAATFDSVVTFPTSAMVRDDDTGAETIEGGVSFVVVGDWTAKGGRLARRLENMAARYSEACEVASVAVTHATGETVYVSPMTAVESPILASPMAPRRDREGWRSLRMDRGERLERMTA